MAGIGTFVFGDNIRTTLAAAVTSSGQTSIQLASTAGLPTLHPGQIMSLTLNDAATGSVYEVVYVTAITGATLTVLRGQENTAAMVWNVGDKAFAAASSGVLASMAQTGLPPFSQGSSIIKGGIINFSLQLGVPANFSFPVSFPNGLSWVMCMPSALEGDLTNYSVHTDSENQVGFTVTVTGGLPGSLVNVWYLAGGN